MGTVTDGHDFSYMISPRAACRQALNGETRP